LRVALRTVDVRPGRGVQDELRPALEDEARSGSADVPFVEVDGERVRIDLRECGSELARGAGDQDAAA
jgi:hypothetical protein